MHLMQLSKSESTLVEMMLLQCMQPIINIYVSVDKVCEMCFPCSVLLLAVWRKHWQLIKDLLNFVQRLPPKIKSDVVDHSNIYREVSSGNHIKLNWSCFMTNAFMYACMYAHTYICMYQQCLYMYVGIYLCMYMHV